MLQEGTYTASTLRTRDWPFSSITFQQTLPLPAILHSFPPIPLTFCRDVGEKVMKSLRLPVTQILAPESQISLKHFLGSLMVDEILIGFLLLLIEATMKERMCFLTFLGREAT